MPLKGNEITAFSVISSQCREYWTGSRDWTEPDRHRVAFTFRNRFLATLWATMLVSQFVCLSVSSYESVGLTPFNSFLLPSLPAVSFFELFGLHSHDLSVPWTEINIFPLDAIYHTDDIYLWLCTAVYHLDAIWSKERPCILIWIKTPVLTAVSHSNNIFECFFEKLSLYIIQ